MLQTNDMCYKYDTNFVLIVLLFSKTLLPFVITEIQQYHNHSHNNKTVKKTRTSRTQYLNVFSLSV